MTSHGGALGSILLAAMMTLGGVVSARGDSAEDSPGAVHPSRWSRPADPVAHDAELEARIDELLGVMTPAEKVGQTLQPQINSVTPADVRRYHLGSVLNGGGGWPGRNKYAGPEDWLALADALWEASMDSTDGKQPIPILWGLDAVHGHNNLLGATLFPHNVGLGAANNPELIRRIAEVTAREVAVTGQDWNFSPTVAVARDGRWGRAYESYSEDPGIVAAYAAAMVEGLQGAPGSDAFLDQHHLIATVKHFLGDGGTEGGFDQGDCLASEEELRQVHAAGYRTGLAAGAQTVMASYSSWHGRKLHGHEELLTGVLKGRMGFDGLVVGDWNGHGQVAGCSNESCAAAFNAGVDVFMVPDDWRALYENTLRQVESGEIRAERLDDAVRRILRVKLRAGMFERGKPSDRALAGRVELLGSPEHRAVARQAVRESLVLLKNNGGVLPIRPGARVLVAGDGADDIGKQSGGWTLSWQGTGNTNADFPGASSIWDGLRAAVEAAGGSATLSPDGSFVDRPDVAVVVYGEDPYAEFLGDRGHLAYASPDEAVDRELLRRLSEEGIPTVSVFLTGRPLWVNPELNASDAFVVAWLPGSEGSGVADVLVAGPGGEPRHDFRGRLSFSWPRRPQQAVLHRDREADGYDPLFAYGHGLSYGDAIEVGELSEEAGDLQVVSRTIYFDDEPVFPWRLQVGDQADWAVPEQGGGASTRGSENLVVRAAGRRESEDARAARWSGAGPATVYLTAPEPIDLTRETNGAMAIAFDVRVDEEPAAEVSLRLGDGADRGAALDITRRLGEVGAGEWGTVAVRLRCFERAGLDMGSLTTPFALATEGSAAMTFTGVRLVPAEESAEDCPPIVAAGGGE